VPSAEVMNASGITSTLPYMFIGWCLGKELVYLYIFREQEVLKKNEKS
jgi:hypothetical protein